MDKCKLEPHFSSIQTHQKPTERGKKNIPYITRRRPDMHDARRLRRILLQREHGRHDIVPPYALFRRDDSERLIAHDEMRPDGLEGTVGDLGETQFLLRFREPEPEFPPRRGALAGGEDVFDFTAWDHSSCALKFGIMEREVKEGLLAYRFASGLSYSSYLPIVAVYFSVYLYVWH